VALFSESVARVVVAVEQRYVEEVLGLAREHGTPVTRLGTVGGDALEVAGQLSIPVEQLRAASEATLPALFG
jgi:phosphoribosylformylglycinamidine synthase